MMNKDESKKFVKELSSLLNRFSLDTACNTPDYILASYVEKCLQNYHSAIRQTMVWHNIKENEDKRI